MVWPMPMFWFQNMGRDFAVWTLVRSSFHHCGARTEKSPDQDEQPQSLLYDATFKHPEAEESRSSFSEREADSWLKTEHSHVLERKGRRRQVCSFLWSEGSGVDGK